MDKLTYLLLTEDELRKFAVEVAHNTAREIIDTLGCPPKSVTIRQAARMMHVSPQTISNWIQRDVISAQHIGGRVLIQASEIQKLFNSNNSNGI